MDIFFQDPDEAPLPPEEVRIREFQLQPWPDGRRVKVYLEVDAFQKRPSAEISILNSAEELVAEVSIIESMTRKMEMNLHLRGALPSGEQTYTAQVVVYYQPLPDPDSAADPNENRPEPMVVDRRSVQFTCQAAAA